MFGVIKLKLRQLIPGSDKKYRNDPMYKFANMSSREHKKLMKKVIEGATRRQLETIKKASE